MGRTSPASFGSESSANGGLVSDKSKNEAYFAKLGSANDSRPENLPPSQGGRYTGFGNPAFENKPSNNYGSGAPPDLHDMIYEPLQALSKGWTYFSMGMEELGKVAAEGVRAAAQGAGQLGRYANENYVKPAQSTLSDPEFRNNVNGYVHSFSQKTQSLYNGLGASNTSSSHSSANNQDDGDFFNNTISSLQQEKSSPASSGYSSPALNGYGSSATTRSRTPLRQSAAKKTSKDGSDDEWEGW
ncbi:uncharacterized protein BYT42DRAFT_314780 [Radiomyces spectabilis]|uniref:uncharacterized protein n=1 Tax=Radiomyces spectabilis TaxID=64574 RepID=UPI002220B085|nr:uncharacterized protein BYT42DRAFT_314780 [Radiomyces spectabilis]KAI8379134.1 hypothetical protein BYT42DRAFT_314780 [Radiomyces spectabilis]